MKILFLIFVILNFLLLVDFGSALSLDPGKIFKNLIFIIYFINKKKFTFKNNLFIIYFFNYIMHKYI